MQLLWWELFSATCRRCRIPSQMRVTIQVVIAREILAGIPPREARDNLLAVWWPAIPGETRKTVAAPSDMQQQMPPGSPQLAPEAEYKPSPNPLRPQTQPNPHQAVKPTRTTNPPPKPRPHPRKNRPVAKPQVPEEWRLPVRDLRGSPPAKHVESRPDAAPKTTSPPKQSSPTTTTTSVRFEACSAWTWVMPWAFGSVMLAINRLALLMPLIRCINWFWIWHWSFCSADGATEAFRLAVPCLCTGFTNGNYALSPASAFGGICGAFLTELREWPFFRGFLPGGSGICMGHVGGVV